MNEPIFHWDIVQGTDEWRSLRAGKITGSVAKLFTKDGRQENGFTAPAIKEAYRLIEERLTGEPRENFKAKSTEYGHEYEPEAVEHYEMQYFVKVKSVGFVEKNQWTGSSPDRLIPELQEGLEIKCFPVNHIEMLDLNTYGSDEYVQCQYNLWVTGYKVWNLYYYHPKLPENCNSLRHRFEPNSKYFSIFENRERAFVQLVNKRIEKYS